jgi:hypothetical protein
MMEINELLKHKRQAILRVAAKHSAYNARVFGSVARGTADAKSGVDFGVDLEHGRSLFDLGGAHRFAETTRLFRGCCDSKGVA